MQLFDAAGEPLYTVEHLDLMRKGKALELLDFELQKKAQEVRLSAAVATQNAIEAERQTRQEDANLANDIYHQRHYFNKPIDGASVKECIGLCTYWANSKPDCDIQIIFNSPGGELFQGLMLFDFLRELDNRGHKVIIGTYGLAASMAGILLQAASPGERYVGGESWLLIHEVSSAAQGSASQLRNASKFADDVCARIRNIFLKNQAGAIGRGTADANAIISATDFDTRWKNMDWWLPAEEVIRLGFADKIGSPVFNQPDEPAT